MGIAEMFTGFTPEIFKEPRGILKPIEWILSIFAFATTTSVTLKMAFNIPCASGNSTTALSLQSGYPFYLEDQGISIPVCNATKTGDLTLLQGSASPAQFYVFVGVMVFLYCLAAIVLYVFCDEFYRKHTNVIIADFIISAVIVLLWLIASSAWAQGVTDLKYYTDLKESGYFGMIPDCKNVGCNQTEMPNFASLNVSIIFGFLNMCVWVGNLWFLFKETPWHKIFGFLNMCVCVGNLWFLFKETPWHKVQQTKPPTIFGFLNMCVWVGNLWFLFKETPWHKVQQTKPPTVAGQETPSDPQRI